MGVTKPVVAVGSVVAVVPVAAQMPSGGKSPGLILRGDDVAAAVAFIRQVGGMQSAEHLMLFVRQLKDVQD